MIVEAKNDSKVEVPSPDFNKEAEKAKGAPKEEVKEKQKEEEKLDKKE